MALSRQEIINRLDKSELVISPLMDRDLQVQEGGIDLRLGVVFIVTRHTSSISFDPVKYSQQQIPIEQFQERIYVHIGHAFILHPGETILGATFEYVVLPSDLTGLIIGRSSWGRLGLVIATALKVNPGNSNCITLELVNLGRIPIALYPGLRIGQLVLDKIDGADSVSMASRYDHAIGPEFSKIHKDPEMLFLGKM